MKEPPSERPPKKKSPSRGLGGLRLGLLIFETKTHPVIVSTMVKRRIRFLRA
jgi:hypothetical protein